MRSMIALDSTPDPSRIEDLQARLQDWGIVGDYDVFEAWVMFQTKDILPFDGGWLEQPRWIRKAFHTLDQVYTFEYLQKDTPFIWQFENNSSKLFPFTLKADTENG